jgi:hypothetical protein
MEQSTEAKPEDLNHSSQEYWKKQLDCALQDPDYRKFIEQGKKIVKRYLNKSGDETRMQASLNLFHVNTNTLESMLFGQTPKVSVDRRYADSSDDAGRVAGEMLQRIQNTDIGLRTDKYAHSLKKALHDYLTVGMGQNRVRYEAVFKKTQVQTFDSSGAAIMSVQETIDNEITHFDYVFWQDFLWQPGRAWEDTEWIAFRTWVPKQKCETRWPKEAKNFQYTNTKDKGGDDDTKYAEESACIWEIWCKYDKRVKFYNANAKALLEEQDDPLKLWGFFPCGKPMMANTTTTKMCPKADYTFAQDLYNEVDILEQRIEMLTRAVKVVGVYDQSSKGIQRMLTEGVDNELIPVDSWAAFAEKGGLKGQIDWLPIEAVVNALGQLVKLRDDAINLLYQITGMSDILRGQSTESRVSATEQNLKAKFASVRIQSIQDMFAAFATDLQMLKTNIISVHYDPQTIIKQSNILATPDAELAPAAVQLIKQPLEALWRVQVRPESVAMVDYAQIKAERTEFMTAMATFLQSATPIIQYSEESIPMLLEIMKWTMAGFKGSQQIEGVLDRLIAQFQQAKEQKAQEPAQPSPEEQAAQAELAKKQQEMQQDQQKFAQEMQQSQQKFQQEMQQSQQQFLLEIRQMVMKAQTEAQVAQTKAMTERVKANATIEKTRAETEAREEAMEEEDEMETEDES